jgi:hypothetical protein
VYISAHFPDEDKNILPKESRHNRKDVKCERLINYAMDHLFLNIDGSYKGSKTHGNMHGAIYTECEASPGFSISHIFENPPVSPGTNSLFNV